MSAITGRQISGFLLIAISVIMALAILGLLQKLLDAIYGFFEMFTGELDSYEVGKALGSMIYWIIHFYVTIALWKTGRRWIKNQNRKK